MLNVPAFASLRRGKGCSRSSRHVSRVTCHTQRGVALIITLILLSVVTFMAITFLALSRRERSAVTTVTDTAGARLAADAALASAEAQIIANVLSATNPYNFSLLVSTNYINPAGYTNGGFNDVNYFYPNGTPITGNDFLALLTNLWYSPRPPVFIPTNSAGANDFRFYLDLNRNGRDDPNGWVTNLDNSGAGLGTTNIQVGDPEWIGVLERPDAPYGPNNKFIARYAFIAVPVGNTLDLNAIHNQAHWGVAAHPSPGVNPVGTSDIFIRNEGVGSWEINLAAFLADLNTNKWGQDINQTATFYQYNQGMSPGIFNQGHAFDDARALLSYRYATNFSTLSVIGTAPNNIFGTPGVNAFSFDNIDGFTYGQPLLGVNGFELPHEQDSTLIGNKVPWVGADNTNHFFSHQDLFDSTKIINPFAAPALGFTDRLLAAGQTNSTYDRYTFYRMLSQLGTDSTPDSGKMNLNYDNIDPGLNGVLFTNGVAAATNFVGWTPLGFFTNAADRLLRAYTTLWRNGNPNNFATTFYTVNNFNFAQTNWDNYPAFGIGHIPVLVSNQFVYSSAVNRLLQLAANIYDATTNNTLTMSNNYPSVFRPLFSRDAGGFGTNLFITGYTNVASVLGINDDQFALPIEASALATTNSSILVSNWAVNVYGVPWIIGAKKGFPSFNKFMLESAAQITRKLEVIKPTLDAPVSQYTTNQMYVMSVTNYLGAQLWNSYSTNYISPFANPNAINIMLRANIWMTLATNSMVVALSQLVNGGFTNTIPSTTTWPGSLPWNGSQPNQGSFFIPLNGQVIFMTNSVYNYGSGSFIPQYLDPSNYLDTGIAPLPQLYLFTTNRLQVVMLDGTHVIDYVQLNGLDNTRNLNTEIADPDAYGLWSTNLNVDIPQGVINQIQTSSTGGSVPNEDLDGGTGGNWSSTLIQGLGSDISHAAEQAFFSAFFNTNHAEPYNSPFSGAIYVSNVQVSVQAPFTPTRTVVQRLVWAANDPLVHYLTSDLRDWVGDTNGMHIIDWPHGLTNVSDRYMPWGVGLMTAPYDNNSYNLAYKDPLVHSSDNWDFPANKFPGVGWLGRVHRGTPWQTVFLKATNILNLATPQSSVGGLDTWELWTGNFNSNTVTYTAPAQDRLLFDLFTTAFNDNATRGTLSVNQTNLAAWSALFSGAVVLSNSAPDLTIRLPLFPQYQTPPPFNTSQIINPAGATGLNSALGRLVQGIIQTRANFKNADGLIGSFEHTGDILSVPQFTEQSPFLRIITNNVVDGIQLINGISDEMYEWLPQQTMSLLRCASSPRYVIYCYGQALKPAPESIYTGGGPYFGMVTNYQIVSETATRAVVRFGSSLTNVITGTNNLAGGINWFSVPVVTNNNAVIENFNILPPD